MTTAKPTASAMLTVCDGRTVVGFILARGRQGYEAFTAGERSLGVYASQGEAANALTMTVKPVRLFVRLKLRLRKRL
jgi:hypothetical protein